MWDLFWDAIGVLLLFLVSWLVYGSMRLKGKAEIEKDYPKATFYAVECIFYLILFLMIAGRL